MRGAVFGLTACRIEAGIIPARAGSSGTRPRPRFRNRDHPRACGEQGCRRHSGHGHAGSSPRVRGAGPGAPDQRRRVGIIPARAGSRPRSRSAGRRTWDHPRACGEQVCERCREAVDEGSSPRVRGAGRGLAERQGAPGIIPARAGSRRPASCAWTCARDHPRACGEQRMLPV